VKVRWWRVGVLLVREGEPRTITFHIRATREERALALVEARVKGSPHAVYASHRSEPLHRVAPEERIAVEYGPWHRSWSDPEVARLRPLLPPGAEGHGGSGRD
jgi:hypothetical protein